MTNEEIVARIQNGEKELFLELWEQCQDFIKMQAGRFLERTPFSLDLKEDLTQAGYFGLVNAAAAYDPGRGAKFLTCLNYYLKSEFYNALGIRSAKQQRDPINGALSLETIIYEDDGDRVTLGDIQGEEDPGFLLAEHDLYILELRDALIRELDRLPDPEGVAIKEYYFAGKTYKEIASSQGCSLERIRQRKSKGLRTLRRRAWGSGLDQYLDDRINYYTAAGRGHFERTNTSAVETAVLRREDLRERIADPEGRKDAAVCGDS